MTSIELIIKAAETIALSTEVVDWCQKHFEKEPSVLLGINDEEAPTREDYPIIGIVDFKQVRSNFQPGLSWPLVIGLGVINPEIETINGVARYKGMIQAEQLRELVENALYQSDELPDLDSEGFPSEDIFHPLWVSYSFITFRTNKSSRQNTPARP